MEQDGEEDLSDVYLLENIQGRVMWEHDSFNFALTEIAMISDIHEKMIGGQINTWESGTQKSDLSL